VIGELPNKVTPFFPGEAAQTHPWLHYADLINPISYTGVVLTPESKNALLSALDIPDGWTEFAHHMTITMGELTHPKGKHDFSQSYPIGSTVTIQGVAYGLDDRVMALKVAPPHPISPKIKFPHITVAVNTEGGGKPFHSNQLDHTQFTPFEIMLEGVVTEVPQVQNNPRTPGGKKFPSRYLKGLTKLEKEIAKYEIDRGYTYDTDDPEAYEMWKSDIKATARGMKTVPSKYRQEFVKRYGVLPKGKGSLVSKLAKATGIAKKYIQKAYDKGLAAWRVGHRPGVAQQQWAAGRAYALVMGAPTSTGKGKPDFKLAVEAGVRDEDGKLIKRNPIGVVSVDDDGSEWGQNDSGDWFYREAGDSWQPYNTKHTPPPTRPTPQQMIAQGYRKLEGVQRWSAPDPQDVKYAEALISLPEMKTAFPEKSFNHYIVMAGGPKLVIVRKKSRKQPDGKKLKPNPVLPVKKFGSYPPTAYSYDHPESKENHDKRQKQMKEHEAAVAKHMRENYDPKWKWDSKPFKSQKEAQAFADAKVHANTPVDKGGAGKPAHVCPPGCSECWKEHHKAIKKNPPATMMTGSQNIPKRTQTKEHGQIYLGGGRVQRVDMEKATSGELNEKHEIYGSRYKGTFAPVDHPKFSPLPFIARKWKKSTFKSGETDYEYWTGKLEEDGTPYIATLKIDGEGVLAHFNGEETVLWNWYDRWRTNFHITDEITKLLKKRKVSEAWIMGELFAVDKQGKMLPMTGGERDEDGRSETVASIIKTTGDSSTLDRQNRIRYAAFDILMLDGVHFTAGALKVEGNEQKIVEHPYEKRIAILGTLLKGGKTVFPVPMEQGEGKSPLESMWRKGMLEPEFEGAVLRFPSTGKTFKVKGGMTADLAVIGYYYGSSSEREGRGGSFADMAGGLALAFMDENGDFVYSGNCGTGFTHADRQELESALSLDRVKLEDGKTSRKWGGHFVADTPDMEKHDSTGKGTMFAVDPFSADMIVEVEYRGLNYGEKPVYRLVDGVLKQVGTSRAPALWQPSFKRYRRDKEMKPDDLRLAQVAGEGEGKWLGNPDMILEPEFSLPPGLVNPQGRFEPSMEYQGASFKDKTDADQQLAKIMRSDQFLHDFSHYRAAVITRMKEEGMQTANEVTETDFFGKAEFIVDAETLEQARAIKREHDKELAAKKMKPGQKTLFNPPPTLERTKRVPMHMSMPTRLKHIYKPMQDTFAAQLYANEAAAEADRTNYLRVCRDNLERLGQAKPNEVDVRRRKRTLICHKKGGRIMIESPHCGCGSPYWEEEKIQMRASDEPETATLACQLCGKSVTENPPKSKSTILMTVPHAAESPTHPDMHHTDHAAMPLATALSTRMKLEGQPVRLLIGEINRSFMDLNRAQADGSEFHDNLDDALQDCDILLDIHSYPDWHPEWGEAQVVLFTNKSYPKSVQANTKKLADHLGASGIKVMIDLADHRNFIQTKGAKAGLKQSELIEVREDMDLLPVAEAIVEFFCGRVKQNPPEGAVIHQLVLRFDLSRVIPLFRLKMNLEDYGFQSKNFTDTSSAGGGFLTMHPPNRTDVTLKFNENSAMVLVWGAQKMTEAEQQELVDLVKDSTTLKTNPGHQSPGVGKSGTQSQRKTVYKPKSLTTSVSRLVMGDLIPQVTTAKSEEKKGEKKEEPKKDWFKHVVDVAKKAGISEDDVKAKAKESQIGSVNSEEKAKKLIEALEIKENPPVYPVPQRITGSKGYYAGPNGADVTGRHYAPATIRAKPRQIIVEWEDEVPEPEPSSSGRRIRFNMVRPSLYKGTRGFNQDQDTWLVTLETSERHYYFVGHVTVETALTLARLQKKSEPRLRPETFGHVELGEQVATITMKASGKEHPVYDYGWVTSKRQNPMAGTMKPTAKMFAEAMGIPKKGMKTDKYTVLQSKVKRRMLGRNQEYAFDWELHLKPERKLSKRQLMSEFKFLKRSEIVPSPMRVPYQIHPPKEFSADRMKSGNIIMRGTGKAIRILPNPLDKYAKEYIKDHKPMTDAARNRIFKKEKLDGKVGSQAFLLQLARKCQNYGEGCGYAVGDTLYWKKGHPHLNEARVDGRMMEGADAFYHTHPAAWEPSQSSPEDFMVYHGMFTNLGICNFYTVMADRIDCFHFPKDEKFEAEEMAEIAQEFEKDIASVFNASEQEFQERLGERPFLVVDQTRYINKQLCRAIPEYYAEYKCFEMSPLMILDSKQNPMLNHPLNSSYLNDLDEDQLERAIARFRLTMDMIQPQIVHVDRTDPRQRMTKKSSNTIEALLPDPKHSGKTRFTGVPDKLDMLRSAEASTAFIDSARKYINGFSGRVPNMHILLALMLYKDIGTVHDVRQAMTNALTPLMPNGGAAPNTVWMDEMALDDLVDLIESKVPMKDAQSKHGRHAMALGLFRIVDSLVSSPSNG